MHSNAELERILDDWEIERLREALASTESEADRIWLLQMINRRLRQLLPDAPCVVWQLVGWLSCLALGGYVLPSDHPPKEHERRLREIAGIRERIRA